MLKKILFALCVAVLPVAMIGCAGEAPSTDDNNVTATDENGGDAGETEGGEGEPEGEEGAEG